MKSRFTWDEKKRAINLDKHHLDFSEAGLLLDSEFRLDVETVRKNEERTQSFAYVFEQLAVLTVVHLPSERRKSSVFVQQARKNERSIMNGLK